MKKIESKSKKIKEIPKAEEIRKSDLVHKKLPCFQKYYKGGDNKNPTEED